MFGAGLPSPPKHAAAGLPRVRRPSVTRVARSGNRPQPTRSTSRGRTTWPWGLGLSQHPLHSAAADLDAGAEDLPRKPARAELRLRKEPAEFVDGPTNRIIDSVPDHCTTQQTRPPFALGSPDPGANRVAMHHEALGGLLDAPSPQLPKLQDGQPLGWTILWPPVWREPLALGTQDLRLPVEQIDFRERLVPLSKQPHRRRSCRGQTCPGQLVRLTQEDGHRVDHTQHSDRR